MYVFPTNVSLSFSGSPTRRVIRSHRRRGGEIDRWCPLLEIATNFPHTRDKRIFSRSPVPSPTDDRWQVCGCPYNSYAATARNHREAGNSSPHTAIYLCERRCSRTRILLPCNARVSTGRGVIFVYAEPPTATIGRAGRCWARRCGRRWAERWEPRNDLSRHEFIANGERKEHAEVAGTRTKTGARFWCSARNYERERERERERRAR